MWKVCLQASARSVTAGRHNSDIVCLQKTHVDVDSAKLFYSQWFRPELLQTTWQEWKHFIHEKLLCIIQSAMFENEKIVE